MPREPFRINSLRGLHVIDTLLLLSRVVWVGGIIFFTFVLAPTVFHPGVLPSRQLTGAVVSRSSAILHGTGLTCGIVFLITSLVDSHVITGLAVPFALRNVIVFTMIALTVLSMYSVSTRMSALRQDMGVHRRRLPR